MENTINKISDYIPVKEFKRTSTLFEVKYPVGHCIRCGSKLIKGFKKKGWFCKSKLHKDNTFYLHL